MLNESDHDSSLSTELVVAPKTRRRAVSRPAGPPQAPAAVTEPSAEPSAPLTKAAGPSEPAPVVEAAVPPRTPRRRATRAQGATSQAQPTLAIDQPQGSAAGSHEPPVEPAVEADKPKRTRSRKSKAESAKQAATTGESADELAARLAEVEAQAEARKQVAPDLADPFASSESALQSLAASIAGHAVAPAAPADEGQHEADKPEDSDELEESEELTGEEVDADKPVADTADEHSHAASEDQATEDERGGRRRRRRRGGRRRHRGGDDDSDEAGEASDQAGDSDQTGDSAEADNAEDAAEDAAEGGSSDDDASSADDAGDDDAPDTGRRRRRRRRRRGEDTSGADDDPSEVVVRVREPRRARSGGSDEVTGIEGSTRMAAKKIRRQEGRAAGRRRAPILSEAEFLARREAVERRMVIRQSEDYTQLAVLEDGVLVEHYVDRDSSASMIGNVYLGRVQNVLPGMEAAFIDIGRGRNAVLYAGEVDWDGFGATGDQRKVETVFKSGQTVLVQVTKDPVGAKGARLTGHISIPGRYIVYSPGGHLSGISRKLADTERHRLKEILGTLIDEKASVIVRTAAEGVSEDELVRDVSRLKAQWDVIEKKVKQGSAPQLLYGEPDLTVRIVRDLFTEDFAELMVQGNGGANDTYDAIEGYVSHVAPHLAERLKKWNADESGDIFAANHLDEQISKALERKVFLPSGGSLVIDRTEAMTVIDVNTGRFTGTQGNLEATVTSNNLEAAEEIVRQLRLRDIGGIIVIDFIDMVLPTNRELLLRRLVECLGRDRTRHQVAEVTSLGLVQMTRKKIGTGLAEAFTEECETCAGRGYHRFEVPVTSQAPADGGDRRGGNGGGSGSGSTSASGNPGNSSGRRGGRRRRGSETSDS